MQRVYCYILSLLLAVALPFGISRADQPVPEPGIRVEVPEEKPEAKKEPSSQPAGLGFLLEDAMSQAIKQALETQETAKPYRTLSVTPMSDGTHYLLHRFEQVFAHEGGLQDGSRARGHCYVLNLPKADKGQPEGVRAQRLKSWMGRLSEGTEGFSTADAEADGLFSFFKYDFVVNQATTEIVLNELTIEESQQEAAYEAFEDIITFLARHSLASEVKIRLVDEMQQAKWFGLSENLKAQNFVVEKSPYYGDWCIGLEAVRAHYYEYGDGFRPVDTSRDYKFPGGKNPESPEEWGSYEEWAEYLKERGFAFAGWASDLLLKPEHLDWLGRTIIATGMDYALGSTVLQSQDGSSLNWLRALTRAFIAKVSASVVDNKGNSSNGGNPNGPSDKDGANALSPQKMEQCLRIARMCKGLYSHMPALANPRNQGNQVFAHDIKGARYHFYLSRDFFVMDARSGLKAQMFYVPNEGAAYLVFAGTEMNSEDERTYLNWMSNIEQGLNGWDFGVEGLSEPEVPEIYKQADALTQYFKKELLQNQRGHDLRLYVCGHSLGGGLAQYAGALHGIPTMTFNAAALSPMLKKTVMDYRNHAHSGSALGWNPHREDPAQGNAELDVFAWIININIKGDVLSHFLETHPLCKNRQLGRVVWVNPGSVKWSPMERHKIDNVVMTFEKLLGQNPRRPSYQNARFDEDWARSYYQRREYGFRD